MFKKTGNFKILAKSLIMRLVFQDQTMYVHHCLGVQKHAQLEKRLFLIMFTNFWERHDEKIKKIACKMHIKGLFPYLENMCF